MENEKPSLSLQYISINRGRPTGATLNTLGIYDIGDIAIATVDIFRMFSLKINFGRHKFGWCTTQG